ncbi:MAG: dienelactone hydrolase family protein [Candidatus Thiodiazotropha sp.]
MPEDIQLTTRDGENFSAYLCGDEAAQAGALILHEWWGLKPHNRVWAEMLADQGYRTVAIDLYDGRVTDDAEQAATWMREIDQAAADRKLIAAIEALGAGNRKLGVYGCSFGGKQAMQASLLRPEAVTATALAYCRMETEVDKLARLQGPVLAIYAQQERTWPEKQESFEQAMKAAGKFTRSVGYDAAHGFTNPTSPRYDAAADRDAWRVLLEFFAQYLK